MRDAISESFLEAQHREVLALAQASDGLTVVPVPTASGPPTDYFARFRARSLIQRAGTIEPVEEFAVAVHFPADYLRRVLNPAQVVMLLWPANLYHPNVRFPAICTGHLPPGTGLVEILWQVYEILTYQRVTPREDDALNPEACAWARANLHRFPIDPRPLKRRSLDLEMQPLPGGEP